MKNLYVLVILLGTSLAGNAQVGKDSGNISAADSAFLEKTIFTKVEVEANFPGGDAAWRRYLQINLNASTPAKHQAPAGKYEVIVRFVVRRDGSISDVVAETTHGYGVEDEAIRIIKNGPKWIPGMQNGHTVNCYRRQPITFVVEGN